MLAKNNQKGWRETANKSTEPGKCQCTYGMNCTYKFAILPKRSNASPKLIHRHFLCSTFSSPFIDLQNEWRYCGLHQEILLQVWRKSACIVHLTGSNAEISVSFRYTCQTGIYVLNTTETVIIHSFFLIMWLLVLRYASSFMGEAFGYFSN